MIVCPSSRFDYLVCLVNDAGPLIKSPIFGCMPIVAINMPPPAAPAASHTTSIDAARWEREFASAHVDKA